MPHASSKSESAHHASSRNAVGQVQEMVLMAEHRGAVPDPGATHSDPPALSSAPPQGSPEDPDFDALGIFLQPVPSNTADRDPGVHPRTSDPRATQLGLQGHHGTRAASADPQIRAADVDYEGLYGYPPTEVSLTHVQTTGANANVPSANICSGGENITAQAHNNNARTKIADTPGNSRGGVVASHPRDSPRAAIRQLQHPAVPEHINRPEGPFLLVPYQEPENPSLPFGREYPRDSLQTATNRIKDFEKFKEQNPTAGEHGLRTRPPTPEYVDEPPATPRPARRNPSIISSNDDNGEGTAHGETGERQRMPSTTLLWSPEGIDVDRLQDPGFTERLNRMDHQSAKKVRKLEQHRKPNAPSPPPVDPHVRPTASEYNAAWADALEEMKKSPSYGIKPGQTVQETMQLMVRRKANTRKNERLTQNLEPDIRQSSFRLRRLQGLYSELQRAVQIHRYTEEETEKRARIAYLAHMLKKQHDEIAYEEELSHRELKNDIQTMKEETAIALRVLDLIQDLCKETGVATPEQIFDDVLGIPEYELKNFNPFDGTAADPLDAIHKKQEECAKRRAEEDARGRQMSRGNHTPRARERAPSRHAGPGVDGGEDIYSVSPQTRKPRPAVRPTAAPTQQSKQSSSSSSNSWTNSPDDDPAKVVEAVIIHGQPHPSAPALRHTTPVIRSVSKQAPSDSSSDIDDSVDIPGRRPSWVGDVNLSDLESYKGSSDEGSVRGRNEDAGDGHHSAVEQGYGDAQTVTHQNNTLGAGISPDFSHPSAQPSSLHGPTGWVQDAHWTLMPPPNPFDYMPYMNPIQIQAMMRGEYDPYQQAAERTPPIPPRNPARIHHAIPESVISDYSEQYNEFVRESGGVAGLHQASPIGQAYSADIPIHPAQHAYPYAYAQPQPADNRATRGGDPNFALMSAYVQQGDEEDRLNTTSCVDSESSAPAAAHPSHSPVAGPSTLAVPRQRSAVTRTPVARPGSKHNAVQEPTPQTMVRRSLRSLLKKNQPSSPQKEIPL